MTRVNRQPNKPAAAILLVSGLALLLCIPAPSPGAQEKVVQIRIVHRDVTDMLTIVKPLVSPYGYISADVPSNSLIVIDDPAAVAKIQALVSEIDQPVAQLKIRVRYGYQKSRKEQSVEVEGRVEIGDVTVGTGDKTEEGLDATVSSGRRDLQDRGEYTIVVRSGNTAFIRSGYDVPYPQRWSQLSHRHGHISYPVTFLKVDTGYDVRPVLVGKIVQIDITPRISYVGRHGLSHPVRFAEAATRVHAPLGEWIDIGGIDSQYEEIHRQILSEGRDTGNTQLRMRLMVTLN